jgi:tetratricopeptide (TPR) repeat protein
MTSRRVSIVVLLLATTAGPDVARAQPGASPPASAPTQSAPSNALAARGREATEAMNDGRFDAAAVIYRELLKALPDEAGLHLNLGMALAMGGHEADAIAPLERALRLQPTLLPARLFLGSIAHLDRVVAAQPKDPESRGLLGQALLAADRPAAAAAQFLALTDLAPTEPRAWYDLAQAWNAVVQTTMASFEGRAEEDAWRTLLLADALRDDGRLAPAFAVYRRALGDLTGTRAAHVGIAAIYEQTNHADWAAAQRTRAATVTVSCTNNPGECAFDKGRYDQVIADTAGRADPASRYWRIRAAAALTKAAFARLEALPDSRERREMRAELARGRGQHVESVAEIKAALTFAPDDPMLLGELALSYHLARDYEQAIAVEKALIARAPDDASMLSLYGQSLLELQRVDEALPLLEKAVKLVPGDGETRAALGRAYVQKGQMAAAIPLLEPALGGDEDGALHFQLARAYQATGQAEKAKPLLEKYQALQQAKRDRDANTETAIVAPDKP